MSWSNNKYNGTIKSYTCTEEVVLLTYNAKKEKKKKEGEPHGLKFKYSSHTLRQLILVQSKSELH